MSKLSLLVLLSFIALAGCGGGGTSVDTGSQPPSNGGNTGGATAQNTSTSLISGYMTLAYQSEGTLYSNDLVTLNRQLSAQGQLSSGGAVVKVKDLKVSHINSFVNSSLAYIPDINTALLLDKAAVKAIFDKYHSSSISDMTTTVTN